MARKREAATTLTTIHRRRVTVPDLVVVATGSSFVGERQCALSLAPIVLGTSAAECDLVIDDAQVSREHCSLTLTVDGIVARDLESKNGTSINGVEIREAILTTADHLRIGDVNVRVVEGGRGAAEIALWPGARFGGALGGSIVMRALFERLHRSAATDETVLLTGPSGSGKEVLARAIHDESPTRKDGPFVVFDAGAVSPNLIEGELFGHVRGAFTGADAEREGLFAEADGGTLFIDEVGELPLDLQPRLLRVLESRQFRRVGENHLKSANVRIIAATHRDLRAAVVAGTMRQDLFYRLAVIDARVPPLAERKEDIEILVEHFLASSTPTSTSPSRPVSLLDLAPGTMQLLMAHDWPGNVRELKNTVARLVHFPNEALESAIDLTGIEGAARAGGDVLLALPWKEAKERVMDRFEASYLSAKLKENEGSSVKTAQAMGISRQMVHRLLVRHGLRGDGREEA